jgi:origin recognition complex subunit 5
MFDQLPQLLSLCPPSLIHIHDPHQHLPYSPLLDGLQTAQKSFVSIDCTECISHRVLFARIINGLANWTPSWSDAGECWGGDALGNWDASFDTFSKAFEALWQSIVDGRTGEEEKGEGEDSGGGTDSVVIMLLNSERLKDFLPTLFVPLTRLSELVSLHMFIFVVSAYLIHPNLTSFLHA